MSVNPHQNIEVITSQSSRGLRNKLRFLSTPFGIVNIYFDGKEHVAYISPDRRLNNKTLFLLDKIEEQSNERKS